MSSEQERSFIARIYVDQVAMATVDELVKQPIAYDGTGDFFISGMASAGPEGPLLTTRHHYNERTGRMDTMRYTSDGRTRERTNEMYVYFRCYEDYYNIEIRSEYYFRRFFSKNSSGLLGAYPAAGGTTTSFNMLDSSYNIITLDNIKTDQAAIYLKARNAGIIKRQRASGESFYTFGDLPGDSVRFTLEILERNVPYPTGSEFMARYSEPTQRPQNSGADDVTMSISAGFGNDKVYQEWKKED